MRIRPCLVEVMEQLLSQSSSPAEWCVGFSILYASIRFLVSSANAEDAGRTEKLYEKLMVSRGNYPKVATLQVSEVLLCRNIPDLK